MANKEILSTYTAPELKKLISSTNIKGYSKLKKDGLIKLMLREEHIDKFKSIKKKEMRTGDPKEKEAKAKSKLLKEFKKRAKPAVKAFELKEDQKKLTKALEKKFPKKKEEEPKKEDNLLKNLKKFIDEYNTNEIKKQNLTKENLKKYTNPYFEKLEKIEKQLENVDDEIEFFKNNKQLSKSFTDIRKNFVRRVKAQLKESKKESKPKAAAPSKPKAAAPSKPKAPSKAQEKAAAIKELKNYLRDLLDQYYGELNQLKEKVLNGSIKEGDEDYKEELEDIEDLIDDNLFEAKQIYGQSKEEDTIFFKKQTGMTDTDRSMEIKLIKINKLDINSLSNYKKLKQTEKAIKAKNKKSKPKASAPKKERSEKQKANDKKLGEQAKAKAKAKKESK